MNQILTQKKIVKQIEMEKFIFWSMYMRYKISNNLEDFEEAENNFFENFLTPIFPSFDDVLYSLEVRKSSKYQIYRGALKDIEETSQKIKQNDHYINVFRFIFIISLFGWLVVFAIPSFFRSPVLFVIGICMGFQFGKILSLQRENREYNGKIKLLKDRISKIINELWGEY